MKVGLVKVVYKKCSNLYKQKTASAGQNDM